MALASKTATLKGSDGEDLTFFVQQLPVSKALRLSGRVLGVFAPVMEKLRTLDVGKMDLRALEVSFTSVQAKDPDVATVPEDPTTTNAAWAAIGEIAPVIGAIMYSLTPDLLTDLTREMFETATLDNAPMLKVMDGKIASVGEVYKALWFALEVNFGSFFAAGRAVAAKVQGSGSKDSTRT